MTVVHTLTCDVMFSLGLGLEPCGLVNIAAGDARTGKRRARYAQSGGRVNITSCHVGVLSTDAFRDANMAAIEFTRTDIDQLDRHDTVSLYRPRANYEMRLIFYLLFASTHTYTYIYTPHTPV